MEEEARYRHETDSVDGRDNGRLSDLITDEELRERVFPGLSRKTTWRWRKRRRNPIPHVKVGTRVFYELDEVLRWIRKQRVIVRS
jgi:predicted DNA-binding transcriptional regulator AlpA